ncbi:reverse transcriptase [Operophtera brumata]|uniref:Reverse transcriptase n=1 Tax=Operophtera brumata TaxID=104452 RepID=A0A0L7K2Y5_OPEBR|nr:reverse transcriptase [Operophtera brumata]
MDEPEPDGRDSVRSLDDNIMSDNSIQRLKRLRNEQWNENDADADGGFIPVERRSKRMYKNGVQKSNQIEIFDKSQSPTCETCEISITSSEPLPKQMALAKLLRSLSIKDIIKIKYKSSYKVMIAFENKKTADLLLQCEELQKKGYKCQRTDEMDIRYGIVKRVDLDINEEELQKTFECEYEIISIWRLKRQTTEGTWVESETVRLCFKGTIIPPYVEAYGCRFIVEPYIFPVSQCSGCWRYGHRVKFCPIKKIFCPKCGLNHANCETKVFKCINCKGSHMSIEKSKCPAFQKEKDIRAIMRDENCSYKKAFEVFQETEKTKRLDNLLTSDPMLEGMEVCSTASTTQGGNYRDALLSKRATQGDLVSDEGNDSIEGLTKNDWEVTKKKQKKKKNKKNIEGQSIGRESENREEQESETMCGKEKPKKDKVFSFMRLYNRIREITASEKSLDEKITNFLSVVFEECYMYIAELFKIGDYLNKILSIFIKNG